MVCAFASNDLPNLIRVFDKILYILHSGDHESKADLPEAESEKLRRSLCSWQAGSEEVMLDYL